MFRVLTRVVGHIIEHADGEVVMTTDLTLKGKADSGRGARLTKSRLTREQRRLSSRMNRPLVGT